MRHSYSALQTLQACERRYAYQYRENYAPAKPSSPAQLRGNAWHAVLQADMLVRGAVQGSLLIKPDEIRVFDGLKLDLRWNLGDAPEVRTADGWETLTPASVCEAVGWWEETQLDSEERELYQAEFGADLSDRLENLYTRYCERWGTEDATQAPLLTEVKWTRLAPNGRELMGYTDAVLWDRERALVVVRDSKSHDSWPSESDAVIDLMDSQLHLQAWGLAPLLRELSDGKLNPQALEFDRVRFKKPATPELTQKGTLAKSTSDYDAYTYRNWCATKPRPEPTEVAKRKGITREDLPLYELDEAVLAGLEADRDKFFRRSMKPLSMRAVTHHVTAAMTQADRAEKVDSKTAGISPGKHCGWCPFLNLCRATIIGGTPEPLVLADWGLKRREKFGR